MAVTFPGLQIKLSVPVVLPLLDYTRATLVIDSPETTRVASNPDVVQFLDLFPPDFESTGELTINLPKAPAVLRACSAIRLLLHSLDLLGVSDEELETGAAVQNLDTNREQDRPYMCYLFLATIQETLVKHGTAELPPPPLNRLFTFIAKKLRDAKPAASTGDTVADNHAEVWVQNDPVNLMAYVTMVFRHVLNLPPDAAEKHMREVHEQKTSKVWSGPQIEAEAFTAELRSWHLDASTKSCPTCR